MESDLERARLIRPDATDAELVIELAERTLEELGLTPAIDHAIVASFRDIIRIEEADIDWSGHIAWSPDGLVITVNATHPRSRQRFTTLHEVVHTYLPGFSMQTQYRCLPGMSAGRAKARDSDIEKLCDIGAAELLFPRTPFLTDLAGNSITSDLVKSLAARYEASLEATSRRVVTLNPQSTLFVALEVTCEPTRPDDEPVLRVQYHCSNDRWPSVRQYKSVPKDSVFGRALLSGAIDEVTSLSDLTTSHIDNAHVSAMYSPYDDNKGDRHMRVLALITRPTRVGMRHG
jgi:Zn-dependent peptidase ImmA (M78 family)